MQSFGASQRLSGEKEIIVVDVAVPTKRFRPLLHKASEINRRVQFLNRVSVISNTQLFR
jgi:hypothetical protein